MEDRRKIPRKYLMFYTRVFDTATNKLIGHLVDVTPGGLMLIGEHPVAPGEAFRLKMELPGEVAGVPFIEFEARSLWSKRDINPQFYNTGFELVTIAPEAVAVIERIVEAYGFRDN
jgi:hypothetical protein